MTELTFTKPQQDWIDWAIGGMDDEEFYPNGQPTTIQEVLANPDATTDLLWRLEYQAQDMVDDDGLVKAQAALNAAKKIRENTYQRGER